MVYISQMKSVIRYILILFLFSLTNLMSQDSQVVTNGVNEYWNPSDRQLFELFTKKYWSAKRVKHHYELRYAPLFVRLEEETERIAALEKLGKNQRASELRKTVKERNLFTIAYMKENYEGGPCYFYYGKDADAIFLARDYSQLFVDYDKKATDVQVEKIAYVLMYTTYTKSNIGKAYSLYIWDKTSVYRIKKDAYDFFFNLSSSHKSSLRNFCRQVRKG